MHKIGLQIYYNKTYVFQPTPTCECDTNIKFTDPAGSCDDGFAFELIDENGSFNTEGLSDFYYLRKPYLYKLKILNNINISIANESWWLVRAKIIFLVCNL